MGEAGEGGVGELVVSVSTQNMGPSSILMDSCLSLLESKAAAKALLVIAPYLVVKINLQEPCVPYVGRASNYPLNALFYIYSTNILTEYFKHAV